MAICMNNECLCGPYVLAADLPYMQAAARGCLVVLFGSEGTAVACSWQTAGLSETSPRWSWT